MQKLLTFFNANTIVYAIFKDTLTNDIVCLKNLALRGQNGIKFYELDTL